MDKYNLNDFNTYFYGDKLFECKYCDDTNTFI